MAATESSFLFPVPVSIRAVFRWRLCASVGENVEILHFCTSEIYLGDVSNILKYRPAEAPTVDTLC